MCKCIAILCLFFSPVFFFDGIAQSSSYFLEKLTTEEGLSSNKINDIIQDDNGFLWVATSDGLNRYDGTEVTQFFYQKDIASIPHNSVYCLKKLRGNHLAIGTHAGLSFYDGNTGMFQNFYYQKNSTLDEHNNKIVNLELDSRGNLWAASSNCIFIFDRKLKLKRTILSPFSEADAARQRLRFVEKLLPLSDGHVLLGLYNGWFTGSADAKGLTKLENTSYKKQLAFLNELSAPPVITTGHYFPYAHIFKVLDRYFLCIKPGADTLMIFDEQGQKLSACFFPYNKYPYVSWSHQVSMIDSTRLFFLFHNYGLAMIPVSWKNNTPILHTPSSSLFESNEYGHALRDRQGNWWLATTEEGLQKISPYKQNFEQIPLLIDRSGQPTKYEVLSTSRYRNVLWIATYGDGFFEINLSTGRQKHHRLYHKANETVENFIWNIRQVNDDTLWVGTQAGLFWYSIPDKKYGRITLPGKPAILDSVSITTQFVDSRGIIWMGLGKGKGLCSFDNKKNSFTWYPPNNPQGYPLRYPTYIAEDKKTNLWFISDASTELVYWNRSSGHFKKVLLPQALQRQLSNLCGIWCDDDSTLWLGSITSGLIKFNTATGATTIYGHDKGLANSHVSHIYKDNAKRLWLATDGGISCFDIQTGTFSNYSPGDGLPVKYATAAFYYDAADRRLYNGGHGASFYFTPDQINTSQPPQKTMITAMKVNGKPYMLDKAKPPRLKARQNDITIYYSAIDLTSGPRQKYAYRLIGEDTNWVMAGGQKQINFSRLAPGNYTFMVRASNSSGVWSHEMASIDFYIRPLFTQTVWFYILILVAMAGLFYTMYRFRLQQLLRTERVRTEISRNLHDEVGSTLTNISLGSLLAQKQLPDKDPAKRILERIYHDSQNVSATMREIIWSINPDIDTLGESLPRMLHYASELLEAEDVELEADISPEIEQVKLTMEERRDIYLIFKEAINNLAKHSKASRVSVKFHRVNNTINMMIADNGIGFDQAAPLINNGIRNMNERANNHRWQLHIQSEPGAGTTITLKAQIA